MIGDDHLENMVHQAVERYMAARYSERHGLVTSYDSDKHLGKVTFQPEGQESGWLPIETGHVGDNFGIAIGLTPGDGKSTGDQVIVRYQEGDIESGKIVQRVHSDQDKPPKVEAGEAVIWTRFKKSGTDKSGIGDDTGEDGSGDQVGESGAQGGSGQQIFFKKDGSITFTDGNGAMLTMDGNGNVVVTCKDFTVNPSGNSVINAGGFAVMVAAGAVGIKGATAEVHADGLAGIDGDGSVIIQGKGNVTTSGVTPPTPQPNVLPPTTVPK